MDHRIVYLVRHGQSIHNAAPVYQSEHAPLSGKGIRQAQTIAERLANVEFETLLASPILRAKQTASYITEATGHQPEFTDLFVERTKPSKIDGQPIDDPESSHIFKAWQDSLYSHDKRVGDGENYGDIISRADKALGFLTERPEQTLVVVTHGFFLTALIARAICEDQLTPALLKNFTHNTMLENTSVSALRYVYDERSKTHAWRLWSFNDLAHFADQ